MNIEQVEPYQNHLIMTNEDSPTFPFRAILLRNNHKPWLEIKMTTKQACKKIITRYNNSVDDLSFKAGLRTKDYLVKVI